MKVAVIGAGAIGGLVGARLAKAGDDVMFLVRGANLEAIAARGVRLIEKDGTEHIERNVRAQTQIVNDLLDMSRIMTGQVRLDMQTVDLREAVWNEGIHPAHCARK